MTKKPPVTPQRLRDHAEFLYEHSPYRFGEARRDELYALSDWLDEHMPLYREAVELLDESVIPDGYPVEEHYKLSVRKRALLAKVKAE